VALGVEVGAGGTVALCVRQGVCEALGLCVCGRGCLWPCGTVCVAKGVRGNVALCAAVGVWGSVALCVGQWVCVSL
jgi:hypothetical protein